MNAIKSILVSANSMGPYNPQQDLTLEDEEQPTSKTSHRRFLGAMDALAGYNMQVHIIRDDFHAIRRRQVLDEAPFEESLTRGLALHSGKAKCCAIPIALPASTHAAAAKEDLRRS